MKGVLNKRQELIVDKLKKQGQRLTKQRLGLVSLLWQGQSDIHVSAEGLFSQARYAGLGLSLATVYNTLNQWAERGLLKKVQLNPSKKGSGVYFDTNISSHHHFFDEEEGNLIDIDEKNIILQELPKPPLGKKINGVEIFIRINRNPLV